MTFQSKTTFSIGDTSKMSGASQKQIRHWEAKGYIPEAIRVVSGNTPNFSYAHSEPGCALGNCLA